MNDQARFEGLLADFLADPEDRVTACAVLDASAEPLYAMRLFAVACRVRDAVLGRRLVWAAGLTGVLPHATGGRLSARPGIFGALSLVREFVVPPEQ